MDISKKDYNSLKKLVELFTNSTETELEALIWGDTFNNYQLFHNNFMNVINYFIHTLKISYKNEYRLNIVTSSSNIRTTIVGIDIDQKSMFEEEGIFTRHGDQGDSDRSFRSPRH